MATVPTKYWHRLEDGRIQCDVCPRFCTLREGQRGLCFVRAREGDQIVLTTYGRSSGFCVDAIEKKPLNHFLPGTSVLSFGTEGCNLSCKFCQNWDISKSREIAKLADEASPERIARVAKDLGCRSVAFTYNDPTIFLEYASDVADACRELGIKTVAVTAGYICKKPREEFYKHIDAANVDLKAFTEKFYWEITGAHLAPMLDTLIYLKKHTNVWLEITNLVIPGHNDSEKEIAEMTRWVVENLGPDVPMHFSAFHPDWKMLGTPARRSFMQKRIEEVIASTLRSKGLTPAGEEKSDLRVFTHVVLETQQRIDTIAYGYGWRWGGGVATTAVTNIPVGTLVVDLVDTASKELVWRGKATDTIDRDSEARDEQLQSAVAEMFQGFPSRPETRGSTRQR